MHNVRKVILWYFDLQQVGRLQQKVDEMDMTQRDIVTEYEEHVMHLKDEVCTYILYIHDMRD